MSDAHACHAHDHGIYPFCPGCGASEYDDNRIDERLYIEAAREAPRLRHEGRNGEAIDLLSALYAIRIVNFIRPRWLCRACGAQFDGGDDGDLL